MAPSLFEITHLHAFVHKLADNYSIRTHHACNTPGIQPKIERQMLIQKSFEGPSQHPHYAVSSMEFCLLARTPASRSGYVNEVTIVR